MPNHPGSSLLMICTGTGSAPMRAMTERRRRRIAQKEGGDADAVLRRAHAGRAAVLRAADEAAARIHRHQLRVLARARRSRSTTCRTASASAPPTSRACSPIRTAYIYVCGLQGHGGRRRAGVRDACREHGVDWDALLPALRDQGRYHLETY